MRVSAYMFNVGVGVYMRSRENVGVGAYMCSRELKSQTGTCAVYACMYMYA